MSPPPQKRRRASSSASNLSMHNELDGHRAPHAMYFHPPPPYHNHSAGQGHIPGHAYDARMHYERPPYTVGPGQAPTAGHPPYPSTSPIMAPSDRVGYITRSDAHGAAGVTGVASASFPPSHHPQHSSPPLSTTAPTPGSRLDSHFRFSSGLPPPPPPTQELRELQREEQSLRRWELGQQTQQVYPQATRSHSFTAPTSASQAHTQTPYRYPPLTQAQEDIVQAPAPTSSPVSNKHNSPTSVQSIGIKRSLSFSGSANHLQEASVIGSVHPDKQPKLEPGPQTLSPTTTKASISSPTTTTTVRRPSFHSDSTGRAPPPRTSPPLFRRDSITTSPAATSTVTSATPTSATMSTNGNRYATSSPATSTSHHGHGPGIGNPLPPLSLSILGVEPLDEFIKDIADFVCHMIMTRPEGLDGAIEVEAKIGLLKEKGFGGQRMKLPVRVESILEPNGMDVRFESNMTAAQHKHFNNLLNNLKTDPPPTATSPIEYSHLFLVDNFYADSHGAHDPVLQDALANLAQNGPPGAGRGAEKIRVTRDEKTNSVVQCVRKIRLGDLNVYSPQRPADWRISVNLEVPVPHPVGTVLYTRRKDRLRYEHEEFVIDLTQVTTSSSNGGPPEKLHELELEIARPELLLATAAKRNDVTVSEHERSAFDELIRAFVNNARILTKNATEGWQ